MKCFRLAVRAIHWPAGGRRRPAPFVGYRSEYRPSPCDPGDLSVENLRALYLLSDPAAQT
jgi:hypothetical protein